MNSKFLLALLTLNGLLFGTNSTFASTLPAVKHHQSSANLSQIISQSIGLTQDTNSLVEFAINRALISQTLNNCQVPNPSTTKDSTRIYQPMVRGRIVKPTPQPRSQPIGKMVNPIPQPVVGQVQLLPDPKPTQPTTTPASPSTNPTPTPTTTPAAIKTPATPTAPTPVSEFRRRVIYGGARG
jgi:hypothetical protein